MLENTDLSPVWRADLLYGLANVAGEIAAFIKTFTLPPRPETPSDSLPDGISCVIPSRNGRPLLEQLFLSLFRELAGFRAEVIVVDNGSEDGTAAWLQSRYPEVVALETPQPLSFARAVNLGIARAQYSRLALLNNDMILDPSFFAPLTAAFDRVPDLFCGTAQIFFPQGARREETGKAVMAQTDPIDFPLRCDLPFPGEDLSYVLYGSGGCSLYSTAKLRALGSFSEIYEPAYVEDLDIGYRAWSHGWPTVFVADARAEHRHRATTSRYYSDDQLAAMLEINYLRFLARAVISPPVFRCLWRRAIARLWTLTNQGNTAASNGLAWAWRAPVLAIPHRKANYPEELFLALGSGEVAVFPGAAQGEILTLMVTSDLPRAPAGESYVLVSFVDHLETPPQQILASCAEIVTVVRHNDGDSLAFRAALQQTVRKWRPRFVRMDPSLQDRYAVDCAPALLL